MTGTGYAVKLPVPSGLLVEESIVVFAGNAAGIGSKPLPFNWGWDFCPT